MRPLRCYDRSGADRLHPEARLPLLTRAPRHPMTQRGRATRFGPLRDDRRPARWPTDTVLDPLRLSPPRYDELRGQDLHRLAALIQGFAAHRDHSPIRARARRRDLDDLAFDVQDVTRPRRLGPVDLSPGADDAAGERYSADHKTHRDRRRVPAARRQPAEQRLPRLVVIDMKRLRVELAGEALDLRLVQGVRSAAEALSHVQILEVE